MEGSEEQLRRNAELKLWMESRIAELQEEMDRLKEALSVIDSVLRASSFKPATELASSSPRQPVGEPEEAASAEPVPEIRELKRDKGGETLAVARVTAGEVRIELVPEVSLKQDVPPFKSFLLGKILSGMRSADEDSVSKGRLRRGDELSYSVSEKGGKLSSLLVEHYRDKERLNEILNTASWTFSRMLEKK